MGQVVRFPVAQVSPQRRPELFISATESETDFFFQTKLGLVEFHAAQGAKRVPYDVDLAALTVAMPLVHRALKAARVQPIEVRAFVDGPPLQDYRLDEEYDMRNGNGTADRLIDMAEEVLRVLGSR